MPTSKEPGLPMRVGVSACIVGQEVRFNGGHKLDCFLRDTLGAFVEFVPVCPEVEIGLGIPREALRLVAARASTPSLVTSKTCVDHTQAMETYARRKTAEFAALDLSGFIVKKGSPSCGMERVKIYPPEGGKIPSREGRGLFTQALMERFPLLPVEEDGRLNDPALRENFMERIFAYRRLRELFSGAWTHDDLVKFHFEETLLLMAHSNSPLMGPLVANANYVDRTDLVTRYQKLYLDALSRTVSVKQHVSVLLRIAGHLRDKLAIEDRVEVEELIDAYGEGIIPRVVPMTLIKHHIRALKLGYLAEQTYLNPYPRELMVHHRDQEVESHQRHRGAH